MATDRTGSVIIMSDEDAEAISRRLSFCHLSRE